MSNPKTVEEFVVEGKLNGKWEKCGYRETMEDAMEYKSALETGLARNAFSWFRIRSTMVKWEESERYRKQQQNK